MTALVSIFAALPAHLGHILALVFAFGLGHPAVLGAVLGVSAALAVMAVGRIQDRPVMYRGRHR